MRSFLEQMGTFMDDAEETFSAVEQTWLFPETEASRYQLAGLGGIVDSLRNVLGQDNSKLQCSATIRI